MSYHTQLSQCERDAIRAALSVAGVLQLSRSHRMSLMSLLERTSTRNSRTRYVVKCKTRHKYWEKIFFEKEAARVYARHAADTWCRDNVRIQKQKWINY